MLEVYFTPFPTLETERLMLVRLTAAHAADIFRLRSDREAMRFIGKPLVRSEEEAGRLIDAYTKNLTENNGITWGITFRENPGPLIGTIGFHTIDKSNHRAEIGYLLHPDQWGQGIMQEAVGRVLAHGFDTLDFHSIEAKVNPENHSSYGLLEKLGFVREAHFRENFFFEGKFLDTYVYSLVTSRS